MPESAASLLARLDDLRRAERRAVSARMVSVAGHLAGTPLNVIAGRAALIRADPSPAVIEENLGRIEEQVERMAMRMRRLIEYFGLNDLHSEHRTVGAILSECQALYSPVAELKGVSLLVEPRGVEHLHIDADVSALILTSLLSLGLRKTAPGQSITLSAVAHGTGSVAFELSLPDLEVPHNFERFEPPEQGIRYDPGTLETCWTCLGLARRIGGSLVVVKAASGPRRHRAVRLRARLSADGTVDAMTQDSRTEHTAMETKKLLMSLGTAIAASKVAKSVSGIELEDILGTVGLSRRRSYFLENLGLVLTGAVIGAGAAILFAPSSGTETRRRLGSEASKLGTAAIDAVREQKDEALRSLSHVANGAVSPSASG